MNISLSFASAGQIIVTGDQTYTLHLRGVVDFKPFDFTINYDSASVRDDKHEVILKAINGNETYKFDIRDIDAGVTYATTADLMTAIQAQVAAMYSSGGGTTYYNGTAEVLQEAIITGVTDANGELAINMSAAPYNWTNIRSACVTNNEPDTANPFYVGYVASTANTGIAWLNRNDLALRPDIPLTVVLKGA